MECGHRSVVMMSPLVLAHFFAIWLLLLLAEHTPSAQIFPVQSPIFFLSGGTLLSGMCHIALVPIAVKGLRQNKGLGVTNTGSKGDFISPWRNASP